MEKICPECGQTFHTKYAKQVFCCKQCCNRSQYRLRKERRQAGHDFVDTGKDLGQIYCAYCGELFTPLSPRQKYCSYRCQHEGSRSKPQKKEQTYADKMKIRNSWSWIREKSKIIRKNDFQHIIYQSRDGFHREVDPVLGF